MISHTALRARVAKFHAREKRLHGHETEFQVNSPRLFSDMVLAGVRIKTQRRRLRIKQEELAKTAGISLGLLSEIENGIAPNGQYLLFVEGALRKGAVAMALEALSVLVEMEKAA